MITPELATALAELHERARREVTSIDPVSVEHPELTIDDAYAVQRAWVDLQIEAGAAVVGHKIGLTSRAMQQQMKGVSDREIVALATHFAELPLRPTPGEPDATLITQGRLASAKYRCGICHLRDYRGREQIPRLAGQREDYLFDIMRTFRDAPPRGSDTNMSAALYGVSDADIRAIAHLLAHSR